MKVKIGDKIYTFWWRSLRWYGRGYTDLPTR